LNVLLFGSMAQYNAHIKPYVVLVTVFGALAITAVVLRFVARSRTKAHYGADDWFALVALAGFLAFSGVIIWGLSLCS
jgi:integral membrane sensor domain MASE1